MTPVEIDEKIEAAVNAVHDEYAERMTELEELKEAEIKLSSKLRTARTRMVLISQLLTGSQTPDRLLEAYKLTYTGDLI